MRKPCIMCMQKNMDNKINCIAKQAEQCVVFFAAAIIFPNGYFRGF